MGLDNDCILNIQSLTGEYFCPVCNLLVYPNEALQAPCSHLYCKSCLTYVVSTTHACPDDGCRVIEADCKPLPESNKALADTIGKIQVHCLYYRIGCTWEGPLSDCISHCSTCSIGESPVPCNRCGVQILHRQVQEHSQSCPAVQSQEQQSSSVQSQTQTQTQVSAQTQQQVQPHSQTQPQQQPQASSKIAQPPMQTNVQPSANEQSQEQQSSSVQALTQTQTQVSTQAQQQVQPYAQTQPQQQPEAPSQIAQPPQTNVQPSASVQSQEQQSSSVQAQTQVSAQAQQQGQPYAQTQPQQQPEAPSQIAQPPQTNVQPSANVQSQEQQSSSVQAQTQVSAQAQQQVQPYAQTQSQQQPQAPSQIARPPMQTNVQPSANVQSQVQSEGQDQPQMQAQGQVPLSHTLTYNQSPPSPQALPYAQPQPINQQQTLVPQCRKTHSHAQAYPPSQTQTQYYPYTQPQPNSRESVEPDDFGPAVSKMAVAQICDGVGFEAIKQSALEAFSDFALRFISDLGKSASFYANLAGRSESNVFDIVKGLQDFSGFSTSQISDNNLINQMSDLVRTVEDMEIPFAYPIPQFPVPVMKNSRKLQTPSFLQIGETPSSKHIPDWLPAFPDPHTYIHSPVWSQKKVDLRISKGEQARQRRKAERSLLNLQQRLLSNGLAGPSGSGPPHVNDGEKCMGAPNPQIEDNPFLAPPLPPLAGKNAYENGVRERKHVLVKETFAPAIDALKGNTDGVSDSDAMEIDRRVVPNSTPVKRRPVVNFKLKAGKKMLVEDLDIHLRNKVNEKRTSMFGRDDDKDDKKRRAEFILRQSSMDNPQELSQM